MTFTDFIINLYNEKFNSLFLYKCNCQYSKLKLIDIVTTRLSFLACVNLNGRTHHKFFPVMIGSNYHLTKHPGAENELKNSTGAFIINGEIKILANILINNISKICANKQQFIWNIKQHKIIYKNGGKIEPNGWRTLIPDENINHDESMYKLLFEEIKENFPDIDHLSNKLILTPPVLLEKTLQYLMSKDIHEKIATKKDLLTNGNITFIFSKQPFSRQTQKITNYMAIEKQDSSIYVSLDGPKIERVKHFITMTKRMIPQESMNSRPLQYPIDGDLFICMLSCKEMKDAGLTLTLTRGVTTTQKPPKDEIIKLLDYAKTIPGEYRLAINCIIQPISIEFSFENYIKLKKLSPNSNIFKYKHFINILMMPNIPIIKFIDPIDNKCVYVTPNERSNIFPNALKAYFKTEDYFCVLFEELSPYTKLSLPSKITVSLNNWRGACYNVTNTNTVAYQLFIDSPGYNSAIISGGDYTHLAVIQNPLYKIPYIKNIPKSFHDLQDHVQDKLNVDAGEILLYVAFTNKGACVEDGFIVDEDFAKYGPKIMINVNFSIRISSSTNQPLNTKQLNNMNIKYIPKNILVDKTIIFGEIHIYGANIKIQQSKRITVTSTQINRQYIHTISHVVENPINTTYDIRSRENFENFCVICSYQYKIPIGVGTKLSNSYGQKSEISSVENLGQYMGRRVSDNAIIKPQILMGSISLVGRTTSGQIADMLASPYRAITQNGEIIAPQKFVVSSICSCTKIGSGSKRIDMLTGPNCFNGNQLSGTMNLLHKQRNNQNSHLTHALNLTQFRGTKLTFDTYPKLAHNKVL